jgi:hypothetical protein
MQVRFMTPRQFWLETLTIFLGDVFATAFVGLAAYLVWYLLKYPGFRVGANWTFKGWNVQQIGRFPNDSDSGTMDFTPNVGVNSYDTHVKKVIHSIWVRERADVYNPGNILGHRNLQQDGVPQEERTTGGDLLNLHGPKIVRPASKFREVVNCPVFIQTSDGSFYKAESVGNQPKGIIRLRYRSRNALYKFKQQLFSLKNYIQQHFGG